jgi:hypothetical protein
MTKLDFAWTDSAEEAPRPLDRWIAVLGGVAVGLAVGLALWTF